MTYSIGVGMIAKERVRQVKKELWSEVHDDQHTDGEMATAAAAYCESSLRDAANDPSDHDFILENCWPVDWGHEWFKPKTPIKDLVRAGALIAAEIDRRLRAGETP